MTDAIIKKITSDKANSAIVTEKKINGKKNLVNTRLKMRLNLWVILTTQKVTDTNGLAFRN